MAANGKAATVVPPQNLEAEESVLGAMMVSQATIDPVVLDERLQADDFYRDRHRIIFEAIVALHEDADPVDVLTVSEELAKHGNLDKVGGKDVIASLAARVPAPGSARHYAKIVKQNSLMRRLDAAGKEIVASVAERDGEASEMVENAERLLFKVAHDERAADFREIRADPRRRAGQARGPGHGPGRGDGDPGRLPRPRRQDRRVPAGEPRGHRREAVDGKVSAGLQHRRERRGEAAQARCDVLARDVRDGAGPPLHRLAGADPRRPAPQGPRLQARLAARRQGLQRARVGAAVDRRLLRPGDARAAREGAPPPRPGGRARQRRPRHGDRGLPAADAQRRRPRQPRRAGLAVQPRAEDPGARAGLPRAGPLAALPRPRAARREQAADPLGPARVRRDRAGRRPRLLHLPRRLLQGRRVRRARHRRADHRQAPQRPDRDGQARVHQPLPQVRRPRPRGPRAGGRAAPRRGAADGRRGPSNGSGDDDFDDFAEEA